MEEQKIKPVDGEPVTETSAPVSLHNPTGTTTSSQVSTDQEITAKTAEPRQSSSEQNPPTGTAPEKNTAHNETETIIQQQFTQPQQTQQTYQLPPGYAVDPVTGQVFFIGQSGQQPMQPGYVQPGVVYTQPPQQPSPEQIAEQQATAQQQYGQVINTVEQFLEGEATVADVVKTLYINTSRDDQLWKGVIIGAAAAVLLTSEPVREVMGKTLGGVFPGLKTKK